MLSIPPPLRKKRGNGGRETAPPQTLVLVSAFYDESVPVLFLTFDRAVDVSGFRAAQVMVNDGSLAPGLYRGIGPASVLSPVQFAVALQRLRDVPVGPALLSATALTGIVALDDRGTWAGATDLGLPYDA